MIRGALYTLLTGTSAVSAIVGTRIYPVVLPQKPTLPAITMQRIPGSRVRSTRGPSGLAQSRYQVDCWAATQTAAEELAGVVRAATDGYRGTVSEVRIGGISVSGDRDFYEPDAKYNRVSFDLIIWHEE